MGMFLSSTAFIAFLHDVFSIPVLDDFSTGCQFFSFFNAYRSFDFSDDNILLQRVLIFALPGL